MTNKAIIGVDPGKMGGFACIRNDKAGIHITVTSMPIAGKDIDLSAITIWMYSILESCVTDGVPLMAYIEKVGAMPQQGVTSMFTFGFGTGAIHGILAALNIPRYMVTPQAWKKAVLAGTTKDKNAAIDYCNRVYPNISLIPHGCRTAHDGLADALCLATYGMSQ